MGFLRAISAVRWNKVSRVNWQNWWDSKVLRQYINQQICHIPGQENGVGIALREYVNGRLLERGISIGCGNASKELMLLKENVVQAFDLYDISAGQVASAKKAFRAAGLENRAQFLTRNPMEARTAALYDLVYWDHSLHHMLDVRGALEWSRDALAQNGVLCINDYVGPARLQWSHKEAKVANAFLASFEKKYGILIPRVSKGNVIKRLRLFLKDPSEAPQSDLIESACSEIFHEFRLRPLGGGMLNICGSVIMNLTAIPEGLLLDFAKADKQCLESGIYHFAFGIWQRVANGGPTAAI